MNEPAPLTPEELREPTACSVNARAESIVGRRLTKEQEARGVVPFDCPCELGYRCPVCKIDWDESLQWSEYASFLWCKTCNFDYPSAMCVPLDKEPDPTREYVNAGRDTAVRVFLDTVEAAIKASQADLAALREENERLRVQMRAQSAALDKGVHHVCLSMRKWRDALEESGEFERQVQAIDLAFGMISKSSMLDRLIYGCEPLRTEKCPTHKGKWSGLEDGRNDCPHGCGLTGWLPVKAPAPAQEAREG